MSEVPLYHFPSNLGGLVRMSNVGPVSVQPRPSGEGRLESFHSEPRKALCGGISEVNFQETLSGFGDDCPQNGPKNDPMAPRTTLEWPHDGPSLEWKREGLSVFAHLRVSPRHTAEYKPFTKSQLASTYSL